MWVGDAVRLNRYWADHPPVHLLVAAYLGVKASTPAKGNEVDAMFLASLGVPIPMTGEGKD